jgi:GNAT superfamily N-acetyltransferase
VKIEVGIEYIEASLPGAKDGWTSVAHVLVTSTKCNGVETETMQVRIHPIFFVLEKEGQTEVAACHGSPWWSLFDLTLTHAGEDSFAKFAYGADVWLPPDLRGRGLGDYAFLKLIEWGMRRAPTYRVNDLKMGTADARTDTERDQRNGFYERLNFTPDFAGDPERRGGWYKAASLSVLTPHLNPKKIRVLDVREALRQPYREYRELLSKNNALKITVDDCRVDFVRVLKQRDRCCWVVAFLVIVIFAAVVFWSR